jgi:hypothetical protein
MQARYPFAPLTVSLFKLGIFISPRLFSSSQTMLPDSRDSKATRLNFTDYALNQSDEIILCEASLTNLISNFWRDVFSSNTDRYVLIQLRIKSGPTYYSLSKFQTVSFADKEALRNIILVRLELLSERYTQFPITQLFFRYVILPQDSKLAVTRLDSGIRDTTSIETPTNIRLPATLDLSKWGKCNSIGENVTLIYRDTYVLKCG